MTNQVRKRDGERSPEGTWCTMLGELWNEANIEWLLTQFMHIAKAIKFQHSCAYIHLPLKSGRGCYSWFVSQSYSILSIKFSHTGKDSILCKTVKMQLTCTCYLTHVHINAQSCMKHNVKPQKKAIFRLFLKAQFVILSSTGTSISYSELLASIFLTGPCGTLRLSTNATRCTYRKERKLLFPSSTLWRDISIEPSDMSGFHKWAISCPILK